MKLSEIKRKKEEELRVIYNNIQATHNLVDISKTHAKDLNIIDEDKYQYIITYSFPCQDLSLAGNQKGMSKNSGTRSGLLWQVERILDELKSSGIKQMPILLMENVSQVHSSKNINDWRDWIYKLETLGYTNFVEDINSKDYGMPQNRLRTFALSIPYECTYKFLPKQELKLKLKDLLETNVDEKYFLSNKMINYISKAGTKNFMNSDCRINLDIARPLTTDQNKRAGTTNYIGDKLPSNYDLSLLTKNKALIETAKKIRKYF
jgi:Site-specific DNA methylase